MSDAQREMTLDEVVCRLPESHAARRKYVALKAQLAEAERKLAKAEEWRDYYRAKWLGEFAVPQPDPPADSAGEKP